MADIADRADMQNEAFFAANLKNSRKPEGPAANGHCLYCNSDLPYGLRWCDKACQGDWELEEAAKMRNGGVR